MNNQTKVVNNITDFKDDAIKKIVDELVKKGIINPSERNAVLSMYESDDRELHRIIDESNSIQRSIITGRVINLVGEALKKKGILQTDEEVKAFKKAYENDSRRYNEIIVEVANISREDLLVKLNVKKDEKIDKPENQISLENVKDFSKDNGKKYISIHSNYPNEQIKVVENRTDKSALEIFEMYKNNTSLPTVDGFVSSMDVFNSSVEPDKKEVKMYNITELARQDEFDKLSSVQKEVVMGTLSSIINELSGLSEEAKARLNSLEVIELVKLLDKDVYLSPDENIVLVCVPNDATKDQPMTLVNDSNGNYKLVSLNSTGHEFVSDMGDNSNNTPDEEKSEELGKIADSGKAISMRKPKKPKGSIVEEAA